MQQTLEKTIELLDRQNAQTFPYKPLLRYIDQPDNRSYVSSILDVKVEVVKRFENKGLSVDEADRAACKLHLHPSSIWPEWLAIDPIDDELLDLFERHIYQKKRCFECREWKDRTDFFKRKNSPDGLGYKCKACSVKYEKERRMRKLENA